VIPVSLAAWYSGRSPAIALAIALPLFHAVFVMTVMGGDGKRDAAGDDDRPRGA